MTRDYPSLVAPVPSVVERDPSASREHGRPWRRLREPIRLALVWGVVAACAVAALATLPTQLRHAHSDIQVGTTRSRQERLEQPARTVGLTDLRIFETAARIIPRDAVYAVVVGRDAEISDPTVLSWVRPYARYTLLPRRLVGDRRKAQWIISYGGDLDHLGLHYSRVVEVARGLSIAKIDGSG